MIWINICLLMLFGAIEALAQSKSLLINQTTEQKKNRWEQNEVMLLSLYWLGSIIDAGQTIYGLDHGAVELNPVLGKKPGKIKIYSVKLALGTLATSLCHYSPSKDRKFMLALVNTIQWSAVLWNGKYAGVGLRLQF